MIRRTLTVSVLAALMLAGLTLFEPRPAETPTAVTTPEGSDHYLLDAVVDQYAPDGGLHYRVAAAESLHFPDDSARLSDIRVDYPGGPRGPWHLAAAHGRVPPQGRDLLLTGGVTVAHDPATAAPVTATMPYICLRPREDRADTEATVALDSPGRRVRAEGMTVYFERDALDLHRDVRVTYNP